MEKFLDIPVYVLLASGTTDGDGTAADELIDSSATFEDDGVAVGDIIHNSTDNTYTTVVGVTSQTVLEVESGEGLDTGKDYFIHSGTKSVGQLVSAVDTAIVEQASVSSTTINYDSAVSGADVMTITHTPVPVGSEAARNTIQAAIVSAAQSNWKRVSYDQVGAELLAAQDIKVIGISLG